MLGAATDITSRKEYENALIESEKKYRSVIENIRDVYYRTDAQGNLAMTNPSGARMFGYDSPEEMTGLPLDMFWDKIDTRKKILETMRETGAANDVEAEFTRKDGTRFSVSVSAHLVFDEYGTFLGTEGIIRDITERKLAAEKLRRNEERMRRILESTNDGYYEWNIMTGEVFINDRYLELMGFARGELAESFEEWKQHVHPDDIDTVMEQLSSAIGGAAESYSAEYRLQSKSGGWIWISDNGRVVERDDAGSPVRFAGVHHDINEQKKAEEALRASEEKYRKIFNNVQDVFYQTDMNGIITEISPSIERHSGYTREELIGKPVNMVYDNREDREEFVSTIIREGEVFDYELHLRSKSGGMVYTSANAHLLIDEKGNPAGIEGSLRDISERKEVEEALRESEHRLRTLINAMPDIICFKDGKGRWLEANDFDLKLFQLEGVEYRGKKDSELAEYSDFYRDAFLTCEETDESAWNAPGYSRGIETIPRPGGEPFIFDIIKVPTFEMDGTRKGLVVVGRDITELKRTEEQLKSSLREKEVLLREVHHRVKNNFQVISSLMNLQSNNISDPIQVQQFHEIKSRIRSMALIHEKLYQSKDMAHIDFSSYIRTISNELYNNYYHCHDAPELVLNCDDISLTIDQAIPCGLIINELLTNIMKYAFPTHHKGGKTIFISFHLTGENRPELVVRDTGIGIPEKIDFETNASLGLTLVRMLTMQLQGTVSLNRSKGTEFIISFIRK